MIKDNSKIKNNKKKNFRLTPICVSLYLKNQAIVGKLFAKSALISIIQQASLVIIHVISCVGVRTGYRHLTNKEKEFIDCIKLKCRHVGCNKFINYSDYKSHFKNCDYRLIKCSNKLCIIKVPFCKFKEHVDNCEWREINCSKCHKIIIFNSKESHKQNDCPEETVKCDICGEEMRRKHYINEHKKNKVDCIKKIALISYKEIMDYKKELIKQQEINNNMEKIINKNKIKINENEKNIKLLMEENELLKKKNKENEKFIEEFKLFMENINNKLGNKSISKDQSLIINNEKEKKENLNFIYNNNNIPQNFLLNKRKRNINSNNDDQEN